jgi:quinolinate synthase
MITTEETRSGLAEEILALKKAKNAVILAHNYELPEVQDVADFVGDSLGLSREAEKTEAERIVFCGVHFMAETASIICPRKRVLIPDLEAGCSLADTINAEQLREWKAKHPGAVVVSYVNTSAEVKAESDYCCTSSNAVKVVSAVPPDKEILFLPDMFLGAYVRHTTGRKMHIWMGECHVHAGIRPEHIQQLKRDHPAAETLVHPECGCTTSFLYYDAAGDMPGNTYFTSTEGMTRHVHESQSKEFIIVTETGILHRMQKQAPDKTFIPASREAVCRFMKMITLEKVARSLKEDVYEVKVPDAIASKARLAIDRMLRIG